MLFVGRIFGVSLRYLNDTHNKSNLKENTGPLFHFHPPIGKPFILLWEVWTSWRHAIHVHFLFYLILTLIKPMYS